MSGTRHAVRSGSGRRAARGPRQQERRPGASFVAVLATIIDVIVFNKNRAEEGVPTVLFPAEDAEN